MTPENKSFMVSLPREGNYETFPLSDETSKETLMKPASLKALAVRVLERNQQGNFNETCVKQRRNFPPENHPEKFRGFTGGNHDAPTLPSWCSARCEHFHKLVVPDLGTMMWCCWEVDSSNWRRYRISAMTGCPLEKER